MPYLDPEFATLPDGWIAKPLQEVVEIHNTKRKPLNGREREGRKGTYPYCGANGVVDYIDDYRFDGEYVLVAEDGGHWGKHESTSYIMCGKFWVNNHAHVVRAISVVTTNTFCSNILNYLNIDPFIGGDARGKLTKAILKQLGMPLPPLPEQKKIAHILSTVQRAIEAQEGIMQTSADLKKALMQKLFTEGLHNEPQKETEIGPVPESWDVVELGTLFQKEPQNGIYKHKKDYGTGTQILRIDDFGNDGDVVTKARNLVRVSSKEIKSYGLETGDIVVNRVNSLSHLGKSALIGEIGKEMIFESNMMRFSLNETQVRNQYIFKFLNSPVTKKQIIGAAKRAVAQSSINQGDVKSILVAKPSLQEQEEIAGALEAIDSKIATAGRKRAALQDLFRTLLHELMTATTRVHDIELPELKATV